MLRFIYSILQGFFTLVGWKKSNTDQQIGRLEQEHADDVATIKLAEDQTQIAKEAHNLNPDDVAADLDQRVRNPD